MACSQCAHCAALPPRPAKVRGIAPGSKGHERCAHHEPIALANLKTPVLCFDDAPGKRELTERLVFAKLIDANLARHRKTHEARPIGDGRIAGDKGERLTARQVANRRKADKAGDRTGRPFAAIQPNAPATSFKSRFTGKRGVHRRRKGKVAA